VNEFESTRAASATGSPVPDIPLVDLDDITPDETLVAEVRRTRITTPATRVLLALVVVGAAMLGGALLDRWQRPASTANSSLASIAAQFGARNGRGSGASGASGGSGTSGTASPFGAGGATVGTVKLVDGTNVYVQDLQGNTIKVTTKATTTVSVTKTGKVGDLAPGSTVIVQGKQNRDGTSMTATSISQSTGLGGGGFGGGATPSSGSG
jgi:hypothetical protein